MLLQHYSAQAWPRGINFMEIRLCCTAQQKKIKNTVWARSLSMPRQRVDREAARAANGRRRCALRGVEQSPSRLEGSSLGAHKTLATNE